MNRTSHEWEHDKYNSNAKKGSIIDKNRKGLYIYMISLCIDKETSISKGGEM